ncbi:hypothetical protein [Arthrobacter celericrescens]|uniref:hypothetical protein n=1 Tax=Arthrobacter celericrescens TaxID=2320851 RepID=UPI000EA2ED1E|nr:hypothetical protein [Arthrobacter celericrescens]
MTSSQTVPVVVAAYAESVRRELDDLAAADVDDLTEGLEADLMEQFEDSGAVPDLSPAAYAAELRSSAGLPERTTSAAASKGPGLRDSFLKAGADFLGRVRANPVSNAVLEFLIRLRPVWWLLRAWAIFQIIVTPLYTGNYVLIPRGLTAWAFLAVLVVLSVRMGSRPTPRRIWMRRAFTTANAISILFIAIMTPAILSHALNSSYNSSSASYNYIPPLSVNGAGVDHVFVYDKDGKLLRDVRFYDQDGSPLDMPLPDGLAAPQQLPAAAQPGEPFGPGLMDPYGQEATGTEPTPSSPASNPSDTESGSAAPSSSASPKAPTPAGKASPAPTVSSK